MFCNSIIIVDHLCISVSIVHVCMTGCCMMSWQISSTSCTTIIILSASFTHYYITFYKVNILHILHFWCLYFYCVVNLFHNIFFISLVKNALNPHYLVNCMYWLNTLALDCEDCEFVERFDLTLAVYLVRQKLWTLWITVCARVTLKLFKANV